MSILLLVIGAFSLHQQTTLCLDELPETMVRNGIFLNPSHTLTEEPISAARTSADHKFGGGSWSRDNLKHSRKMSIEASLERERLGGLLNSTRGPRDREPRLIVLPKDIDLEDSSGGTKQFCSDDHCLEEGYDKLRRPHLGTDKPLRIGIELDGLRILEVEDKTFSISIQMYLGVRWTEPRMSGPSPQGEEDVTSEDDNYYYEDYYDYFSNDSFVALDTKFVRHLWVPDLYVYHMKYGSRVLADFDGNNN